MRKLICRPLVVALVIIALGGCRGIPAPAEVEGERPSTSWELSSPAFGPQEPIPAKYTCDGEDASPPLEWGEPPQDAASLALIADDPDAPAGTWVHWVLYDLPPQTRSLPEDIAPDPEPPIGGRHGQSSWHRLGYGGPCPPSGTHRYYFRLYALDRVLDLDPGATKQQLLGAMEGHVLAQAELMGTYARQ
jgi:Raf kinase inhibitor-like YbhB/YbcL family protein